MSRYTKVVIESDSKGRMSISCVDAEGYGHGYRIDGEKFVNDIVSGQKAVTVTHELTEEDVREIRIYLRIWDEIQERRRESQPTEG